MAVIIQCTAAHAVSHGLPLGEGDYIHLASLN